jgi:hypothetical protein
MQSQYRTCTKGWLAASPSVHVTGDLEPGIRFVTNRLENSGISGQGCENGENKCPGGRPTAVNLWMIVRLAVELGPLPPHARFDMK